MIRIATRKVMSYFLGGDPKLHTIPFGPLRGEKIFMSFDDGPSMYMGIHELNNFKLEVKYIKNGMVIFDVGAHVGYTALFFSKLVSDSGSVHAFELIPSTANMLGNTINNANKSNIFIHNVGLGKVHSKRDFLYDDENMGSILYKMENFKSKSYKRFKAFCEMYPLDDYLSMNNLGKPDLIKVDIEGGEIDFLIGAIRTITKYKPDLMIEFHGLSLLESGYNYFNDINYSMVVKGNKKINKTLINNLSSFHGESCFCFSKGKYNNVVF